MRVGNLGRADVFAHNGAGFRSVVGLIFSCALEGYSALVWLLLVANLLLVCVYGIYLWA
jgi:hypothetical protein